MNREKTIIHYHQKLGELVFSKNNKGKANFDDMKIREIMNKGVIYLFKIEMLDEEESKSLLKEINNIEFNLATTSNIANFKHNFNIETGTICDFCFEFNEELLQIVDIDTILENILFVLCTYIARLKHPFEFLKDFKTYSRFGIYGYGEYFRKYVRGLISEKEAIIYKYIYRAIDFFVANLTVYEKDLIKSHMNNETEGNSKYNNDNWMAELADESLLDFREDYIDGDDDYNKEVIENFDFEIMIEDFIERYLEEIESELEDTKVIRLFRR